MRIRKERIAADSIGFFFISPNLAQLDLWFVDEDKNYLRRHFMSSTWSRMRPIEGWQNWDWSALTSVTKIGYI